MRSDQEFLKSYREMIQENHPRIFNEYQAELNNLGKIELCLHFQYTYLPKEDVALLPHLIRGYLGIIEGAEKNPLLVQALACLRHLAIQYSSQSVWERACQEYHNLPQFLRCYSLNGQQVALQPSSVGRVLELLSQTLAQRTPWKEDKLEIAILGAAEVRSDQQRLVYQIPSVPIEKSQVQTYDLTTRTKREPIQISWTDLLQTARRIDEVERKKDWPSNFPPLNLEARLKEIQPEGCQAGVWDANSNTFTIQGQRHVVGMPSSGKSTLVLTILFYLTQSDSKKRVALFVSDTARGAYLSAVLRKHGIQATLHSSPNNRGRHLNSIYRNNPVRDLTDSYGLSELNDLTHDLKITCPLMGAQGSVDDEVHAEEKELAPWPLKKKPCHQLYQKSEVDLSERDSSSVKNSYSMGSPKSCPLWAGCPTQLPQKNMVSSQVVLFTPHAFIHTPLDRWVSRSRISVPELSQYHFDLMIVDEVDAVQQILDSEFAPKQILLGSSPDAYMTEIGSKTFESLQEKSGSQFSRPTSAVWHIHKSMFEGLVNKIYSLLQRESDFLRRHYENTPFTGLSLLFNLRKDSKKIRIDCTQHGSEEHEGEILIALANQISLSYNQKGYLRNQRGKVSKTDFPIEDESFQKASHSLCQMVGWISEADHYSYIIEDVEQELLSFQLDPFLLITDEERNRILSKSLDTHEHNKDIRRKVRENALVLVLAVTVEVTLWRYSNLLKYELPAAKDFGFSQSRGNSNTLLNKYRSLIPSNPGSTIFGFSFEETKKSASSSSLSQGGTLSIVRHLGIGRHLLIHLHDLLQAEGQVGPHVLMLSGTSWAGGSSRKNGPKPSRRIDAASPSYDVQVPVHLILKQPVHEVEAIKSSLFTLVNIKSREGRQVRVSGVSSDEERHKNLTFIARSLTAPQEGGGSMLTDHWDELGRNCNSDRAIMDRRRTLIVTHSYEDAKVVADAAAEFTSSEVYCLTKDPDELIEAQVSRKLFRAKPLPRSFIEKFGDSPEGSILVAPIYSVCRGHNILNASKKAAISSIYFVHRPHPRPDDLKSTIARTSRFAIRHDTSDAFQSNESALKRAQNFRKEAQRLSRRSMDFRGGYRSLPPEFQAQFAWDLITLIWQTVGRGIRGGCPVFVGFVDAQFAPNSFHYTDSESAVDSPGTSVLVQMINQLQIALDAKQNPQDSHIAKTLYESFYQVLSETKGIKI